MSAPFGPSSAALTSATTTRLIAALSPARQARRYSARTFPCGVAHASLPAREAGGAVITALKRTSNEYALSRNLCSLALLNRPFNSLSVKLSTVILNSVENALTTTGATSKLVPTTVLLSSNLISIILRSSRCCARMRSVSSATALGATGLSEMTRTVSSFLLLNEVRVTAYA